VQLFRRLRRNNNGLHHQHNPYIDDEAEVDLFGEENDEDENEELTDDGMFLENLKYVG
jgi:hypothetical protein